MELSSPEFADGDPIPSEFGYTAANVNPPLSIDDVPPEATTVAVIMDDPDAVEPAGKIWDHWVVWNIDPEIGSIPRAWTAAGAVEGQNDFGERGYGGPNPPDGRHTYRFRVVALDTELDLTTGATKADLERAMDGHVLADAQLTGTFAP